MLTVIMNLSEGKENARNHVIDLIETFEKRTINILETEMGEIKARADKIQMENFQVRSALETKEFSVAKLKGSSETLKKELILCQKEAINLQTDLSAMTREKARCNEQVQQANEKNVELLTEIERLEQDHCITEQKAFNEKNTLETTI